MKVLEICMSVCVHLTLECWWELGIILLGLF